MPSDQLAWVSAPSSQARVFQPPTNREMPSDFATGKVAVFANMFQPPTNREMPSDDLGPEDRRCLRDRVSTPY